MSTAQGLGAEGGLSDRPIRIIQIGAGGMGRNWLRTIGAEPEAVLVGLVDLDLDAARGAADELGHAGVPLATSLTELVESGIRPDAVVNVTVPPAHAATSREALFAGVPVLCEKPIAPTVATGLQMAAAAEAAGQLLMISQSRRYFVGFDQLRAGIGSLGTIGAVSCEFFKAPHFGGFREEMEHPLRVDMAIHQFDAARALLGNPVSVYCEAYNPSWSWYAGDASANAVFEFAGGARFSYAGSWCAPGSETSWNGSWRVSGEQGTALWDGDHAPTVHLSDQGADVPAGTSGVDQPDSDRRVPEQIAGSLVEFIGHLRNGTRPDTIAAANVVSLAMVEAAVASAASGMRVEVATVIQDAYTRAARELESGGSAADCRIAEVLRGWDVLSAVGLTDHP